MIPKSLIQPYIIIMYVRQELKKPTLHSFFEKNLDGTKV